MMAGPSRGSSSASSSNSSGPVSRSAKTPGELGPPSGPRGGGGGGPARGGRPPPPRRKREDGRLDPVFLRTGLAMPLMMFSRSANDYITPCHGGRIVQELHGAGRARGRPGRASRPRPADLRLSPGLHGPQPVRGESGEKDD